MKKTFIIFYVLICFQTCFSDELFHYISPGVRFGYQFNRGLTFGVKMSVGRHWDGNFCNVTLGFRILTGKFEKKPHESYNYIEIQGGKFSKIFGRTNIVSGAGIGLILYHEEEKRKFTPKISFGTGFIAVASYDVIFIPKIKPVHDFGVRLVLPIPHTDYESGLR